MVHNFDHFMRDNRLFKVQVRGNRAGKVRKCFILHGVGFVVQKHKQNGNTMKMGTWKDSLAECIKVADLVFCYTSDLGWDVEEALKSLGSKVVSSDDLEKLIEAITIATRPGDYVLIMSNGGFGGIHKKLLKLLSTIHQS